MSFSKKQVGQEGEDRATDFLQKQGYTILERNFHSQYGEIDIIAKEKNVLCFVEVKARYSDEFGTPEEAITPYKLKNIEMTGNYYRLLHPEMPEEMRIDAVLIEFDENGKLKRMELMKNVGF